MTNAAELRPCDILVVAKDPRKLLAINAALQALGCVITSTTSEDEARALLSANPSALLVLDLEDASAAGLGLARELAAEVSARGRAVVGVTALLGHEAPLIAGSPTPAVELFLGPVRPEALRERVAAALRGRLIAAPAGARACGAAGLRETERLQAELKEEHSHAALLEAQNEQLERIRAALESSNQQLAQRDRRKDEFLAMLGHELRNPLGSISAAVDLLDDAVEDNAQLSRIHKIMRRQLDHLTRLVDDLFDVARIKSGRLELSRAPITIDTVVHDAVEISRRELQARGHKLTVDLSAETLWVHGDEVRLTQALSNVLINAARYTEPGGRIELSCHEADGDSVVIVVRDNGIGMDAQMLARVFELFTRHRPIGTTAGTGSSGLGVGLSLVERLVKLHDGQVRVLSEGPGAGTTVEIALPLIDPPSAGPLSLRPSRAPTADDRMLKIVLVEDNEDIRELMHELLQSWGHEVRGAANAAAGIGLILESHPDLALVDLGLPDADGSEVARQVCQALGAERPRLVAVSGFTQRRDQERTAAAGFDAHLAKPVRVPELRRLLSSFPSAPA